MKGTRIFGWLGASLALLPGCIARSQEPQAPARQALLVGCTRYASLLAPQQLQGPANDVRLMRDLLTTHFAFPTERIVTLSEDLGRTELRPTRSNIEREFQRLARETNKGDYVVILMAGHGSQQPNNDPGDPDDPEPDGMDEIFLPADIGKWSGRRGSVENAIVDDELRAWIGAIRRKGASIWILMDACHSGTMIRGADIDVLRQVPVEVLVPSDVLRSTAGQRVRGGELRRGFGDQSSDLSVDQDGAGLVALYAAQSTETTVEMPLPPGDPQRQYYGLLTYTVNEVLLRAQSPLTYRELAQAVQQRYVQSGRTFPTPLLEGNDVDRHVLGQSTLAARPRILLSKNQGAWTANQGSLHGLSAGSVLAVFPPAGEANANQLIGHVKLIDCGPVSSKVEPCAYKSTPLPETLPEHARCQLVYLDYGDLRLSIAVDADPKTDERSRTLHDTLTAQVEALRQAPMLNVVRDAQSADWLVRLEDGKAWLIPATGLTAPDPDTAGQAEARFGPAPVDGTLASWLRERLERIARVQNLLKLSGDGTADVVLGSQIEVQLQMLRFKDNKDRAGAVVPFSEQGRLLKPGEVVVFRVTNVGRAAVDVTLLFLDSSYGIQAIFPLPYTGSDNRLLPGKVADTRPFRVTSSTVGLEHALLIAVPARGEAADFSCLAQPTIEAVRGTQGRGRHLESPIGRLLLTAAYAEGGVRGLASDDFADYIVRGMSWRTLTK